MKPQPTRPSSQFLTGLSGRTTQSQESVYVLDEPFGRFVVDIDLGGTFTDVILSRKNLFKFLKVDTTPHDLSHCLQQALERTCKALSLPDLRALLTQTEAIRLSTSLSTNLMVERKGARCGLVLTKGWKRRYLSQILSIRDSSRIVFKDLVLEIDSGINPNGHSVTPISEEEVRDKTRILLEQGAAVIVVSLMGAEICSEQEHYVKSIVHKYYPRHCIGSVPVLLGSQMTTRSDYIKRTNTALFNAYCHGAISLHLFEIEEFLRKEGYTRPLLVVSSSGGTARVAKTNAIQTINSGAAAGIFGVCRLAESYECPDLVSVDVGGTSTEIGLLRAGEIEYARPAHIDGLPIETAFPVVSTLGIGGGSIARIGQDGKIILGPESAGAFPGPVCYDLGGTEPTLTDAYLILGYLDENYFLGGQKGLKKKIARKVFRQNIATPLGISCEEAAFQVKSKVVEIIGEAICNAIGLIDLNPEEIPLFSLGGGGGCIGADLTDYVGIGETFIFRQGSVFGAFGSSCMNVMHVYERRITIPLFEKSFSKEEICRRLNATVVPLQRKAFKDMSGEGFKAEEIRFELELELRSDSVGTPLRLTLHTPFLWPPRDWQMLMESASQRFSDNFRTDSAPDFQISMVMLKAFGNVPCSKVIPSPTTALTTPYQKGSRAVYVGDGRWVETRVYERDLLPAPGEYIGPAVIESQDTTIVVPSGKKITLDEDFNGIIRSLEKNNES